VLFNDHKTVALLANKGDAAREILDRIKVAYEALPAWLQQGVVEWNKGSVEFENGCKIIASATSSSAIRGKSISLLYIDETAFVENWDEFFASVFPTISSGNTTKILFTSTPNGLNHFYKTCEGASQGTNGYQFVKVMWQDVPGRDDAWKQETLSSMDYDYQKFSQEFECEFLVHLVH
jgi:phage FluMu gp28-like protein